MPYVTRSDWSLLLGSSTGGGTPTSLAILDLSDWLYRFR